MPDPVVVVPYDPAWPDWFAQVAAFVAPALVGTGGTIAHVGSTAVPGLAAKPVIDIDVIVDRPRFPHARARLEEIGYLHQGDQGITDREAFKLTDPRAKQALPPHHLYVCMSDAAELRRHLLFRDYLRAHAADAQAYARLKCRLADRFRDDRDGYTEAKGPFIRQVMRNAGEWAQRTGWAPEPAGA